MLVQEFRKFSAPLCQAHKAFNKVFGIGANKTGTTTLQQCFHIAGLNVAPQEPGEVLGMQLARGVFDGMRRYIDAFDAFQDAPFAHRTTFAQVDAMYPGSRFVLTVREPEAWFSSLIRFHKKIMGSDPAAPHPTREEVTRFAYLYQGYMAEKHEQDILLRVDDDLRCEVDWSLSYKKDHLIARYLERNRLIARHFAQRPKDLLVIDVSQEKTTERLIDFLGLPRQLVTDMPHANRT
jgi:Sulfotransferase domain